jgi:hypothetical protein
VVRGYDALNQPMWTTMFHLVWCDQAPENTKLDITKMLAVSVEPATTFPGEPCLELRRRQGKLGLLHGRIPARPLQKRSPFIP